MCFMKDVCHVDSVLDCFLLLSVCVYFNVDVKFLDMLLKFLNFSTCLLPRQND